jgi:hypothetical protein
MKKGKRGVPREPVGTDIASALGQNNPERRLQSLQLHAFVATL